MQIPGSNGLAGLDELGDPIMVDIQGKDHPSADGLIRRAHRNSDDRGFVFMGNTMTTLLLPTPEYEMCIVKAVVKFAYEDEPGNILEFEEIADATPDNCGDMTGQAFVRMASTRALSRAMALALNVMGASAEEMAAGGGRKSKRSTGTMEASEDMPDKPLVAKNFPSAKEWKFTIPGGDKKGLRIDDPQVEVEDLNYWRHEATNRANDETGFWMKDQKTGEYTKQDTERNKIFDAEIKRREGGAHNPTKASDAKKSSGTTKPAANKYKKVEEFNALSHQPKLLAVVKASGQKWPDAIKFAKESFDGKAIKDLDKDEFDMCMMEFGGEPLDD